MAKSNIPLALRQASAANLRNDIRSDKGHKRPNPTANNFGSSIDFNITTPVVFGGETSEVRLVTGDADGLHGNDDVWDGSSWIFTGGQIKLNPNFTNSPSGFYFRIRYGTGGYMQDFLVSAAPFVRIALPATTVYVTVFGKGHNIGGNTIQTGVYTFAGNLHRGTLNESNATLLTFPDDVAPGAAVGISNINVPPFSKRVRTLGATTDAQVYGAGISVIFNGFGNLSFTGPELLALKNAGKAIDIPPGTNQLLWTGRADALVPYLQWDIEV